MRDGVRARRRRGDDRIDARDGGEDEINCGAGNDVAIVDARRGRGLRLRGGRGSRDRPARRPLLSSCARGELADPGGRRAPRGRATATRTCAGASSSPARRRSPGRPGMAGVLPAETLVAEAAKRAGAQAVPKPRDLPIDTFVVLMMENRSFDHYFGWHPKRRRQERRPHLPGPRRHQTFATHHLTPDFQGCGFRDPDHGWDGGRHQHNGGKHGRLRQGNEDGHGQRRVRARLLPGGGPRLHPGRRRRLPALRPLLLLDHGLDLPNRHYQLAAQSGGQKSNESRPRPSRRPASSGRRSSTAPRRAGLTSPTTSPTCRCRRSTASAGWPGCGRSTSTTARRGRARCRRSASSTRRSATAAGATGSRPTSTRTATSASARRSCPTSSTPSSSRRSIKRGALFIVYDEWGGFFDHVRRRACPTTAQQPRRPRQGLVADGLPHPGGRGLALRAQAAAASAT